MAVIRRATPTIHGMREPRDSSKRQEIANCRVAREFFSRHSICCLGAGVAAFPIEA